MGKNHFSSKRGRGGGGGGRGRRDGGKGGRGGRGPYVDFRAPGYNDGKMTSLEESQVGINAFLSNEIQGFPGAIKQRYSDFIVREVDLQGKVVALTEVKRHVPATTRDQKAHEVFKHRLLGFLDDIYQSGEGNEKENKMNIPPSIYQIVKSLARRMLGLLNQNKRNGLVAQETKYFETLSKEIEVITSKETSQQLLQCLERIIQLNQNPQEEKQVTKEKEENDLTFFFPPIEDKTFRTKVHELLREYASTLVVSDTVANPNGVSVIRVRRLLQSGKKRKDIDQRSKKPWPTDRRT
jgi:tRNA pseudouridine13 synthase